MSLSVPSSVVVLGDLLDLRVEEGEHVSRFSTRRRYVVCADGSKKRLWLLPKFRRRESRGERFDKLAKVYREWSQFESEDVYRGTVRLGDVEPRGRVRTIGYRSDKWTGDARDYEHDFDAPPRLVQCGEVYRIAGQGLRVTPRGVVG